MRRCVLCVYLNFRSVVASSCCVAASMNGFGAIYKCAVSFRAYPINQAIYEERLTRPFLFRQRERERDTHIFQKIGYNAIRGPELFSFSACSFSPASNERLRFVHALCAYEYYTESSLMEYYVSYVRRSLEANKCIRGIRTQ